MTAIDSTTERRLDALSNTIGTMLSGMLLESGGDDALLRSYWSHLSDRVVPQLGTFAEETASASTSPQGAEASATAPVQGAGDDLPDADALLPESAKTPEAPVEEAPSADNGGSGDTLTDFASFLQQDDSPEPKPAAKPKSPLGGDTARFMISRSATENETAQPVSPPSERAETTAPESKRDDTVGDFLAGFGSEPAAKKETPPADPAPRVATPSSDRPLGTSSSDEVELLRQENRDLRAEIDQLRASSSAAGAPVAGNATAVLEAFGVKGSLPDQNLEESVARELEHLKEYFAGTRRNLEQVYDHMANLALNVPPFPDELRSAIVGDVDDLSGYLESLRNAWKALAVGIWNHLEDWCYGLAQRLDPDQIEAEAGGPKKAWGAYRDKYRMLDPYRDLTESLRIRINDGLLDQKWGVDPRWLGAL